MDWVHCNSCFAQLDPGISLYLTSCGHMYCNVCLDQGVRNNHCKICQSSCTTMKLVPDMKQEVLDFFTEPEELVSKLSMILEFQRKHRMRLTAYRVQLSKKYKAAKDEIKRLSDVAHKLNSALKDVQQKYKNLKSVYSNKGGSSILTPVSINSPMLTTPQKPTKSTPFPNVYQSSLVTPSRLRHQRSGYGCVNHRYNTPTTNVAISPRSSASSGYNLFLQNL